MLPNDDSGLRSSSSTLLAVVVLYRCSPAESQTCRTLLDQSQCEREHLQVLLFDNSPSPVNPLPALPGNWTYLANGRNGGLIDAYQSAIRQAKGSQAEWLLVLDQDTQLPPTFLRDLSGVLAVPPATDVAAVVPVVSMGNTQLSPMRPVLWGTRPLVAPLPGNKGWVLAINSGSVLRVSFLESLGAFPAAFWLDFLDYWIFRQIHVAKMRVEIFPSAIQHHLSVLDLNRSGSLPRYRNMLQAEAAFTNNYLPWPWQMALALRLFARALKHSIRTHDKRYARAILKAAAHQAGFVLFGRRGPAFDSLQ